VIHIGTRESRENWLTQVHLRSFPLTPYVILATRRRPNTADEGGGVYVQL